VAFGVASLLVGFFVASFDLWREQRAPADQGGP
jgi:hypothetical protein